ncbi:MAG: hypothetical protein EXS05_21715 [Planctomycetaceae bacterium]|nr:hypothetical protein [Planctomycetaceae bacterium]
MRFPAGKLLATVICSLSLLGATVQPTEACCFLDCLFGWCGGNRCGGGCPPGYSTGAMYAPSYGGGGCSSGSCGSSSYYAPLNWGGSSACSSCSSDPYAASCADGNCAAGSSVASPVFEPEWRRKKGLQTYGPNTDDGSSAPLGAPGNGGRTLPDSGLERDDVKPEGLQEDDNTRTGFRLPTRPDGTGIERTNGDNLNPSTPVNPKAGKKGPRAPAIPDDEDVEEKGSGRLPTINLDEKVAWRPVPERKRVQLKPRVANARLIRVPAYPKSDWIPETPESPKTPESKVAKK